MPPSKHAIKPIDRQVRLRTKLAREGGRVLTTNIGAAAVKHLVTIQKYLSTKDGPVISQRAAIEAALEYLAKQLRPR